MRKRIALSLMVAAILVGVGIWVHAQVQLPTPGDSNQTVISGADIGFRVDRWEGKTPVGRWVVRSDGKWIEPRTTGGIRRLTSNP
jgi:hypothetical protein